MCKCYYPVEMLDWRLILDSSLSKKLFLLRMTQDRAMDLMHFCALEWLMLLAYVLHFICSGNGTGLQTQY